MFHVEHETWKRDLLAEGAAELEIPLSDESISQLIVYSTELLSWNRRVNLTAVKGEEEVLIKHFLDSLIYGKHLRFRSGDTLLDVGSGAGFPGVPLRILCPALNVTLLEPSSKKTAFLHHLIGTLGLKGTVVGSRRVQEFSRDPDSQGRFGHVATRALNPEEVLPFVPSLLAPEGRVVLWRARPLDLDPRSYGFSVADKINYRLPRGHGQRCLIILEKS